MSRKAKLIRVNFDPAGEEVKAFIVALVDKEKEGYNLIVKEAYSNWSTDNNISWEKKDLEKAISNSSYSLVGNVELEEPYTDWEDFNIIHFQKTKAYKS